MTLRTPRRRISPRTRQRYRVIRNFFRRAIGSTSQPDIRISSSIAINVTDLKQKILGLENQLNDVNRHCQDITCFGSVTSRQSDSIPAAHSNKDEDVTEKFERTNGQPKEGDSKLLCKSIDLVERSEYINKKSREHEAESKWEQLRVPDEIQNRATSNDKINNNLYDDSDLIENFRNRLKSEYKRTNRIKPTTSSYAFGDHRMAHCSYGECHDRDGLRNSRFQHSYNMDDLCDYDTRKKEEKFNTSIVSERQLRHKNKHKRRDLNQDFITDIIRRQYKPVRMFGRKESALSQFSAPVCRDQEFSYNDDVDEDSELCSCCCDRRGTRYKRQKDLNSIRSICDTRLYSAKRNNSPKIRRKHGEKEVYDMIPVKERSSPKSRKKFVEDFKRYAYYKEVPPSPRTYRPQLNLTAQYPDEFEDCLVHKRMNKSPVRQKRHDVQNNFETDLSSETPLLANYKARKLNKAVNQDYEHNQNEMGTFSSLQYPIDNDKNINLEPQLNNTQETDLSVDKTDKALCEIKDILQSFLLEIKKETTVSQCEKSDVTSKGAGNEANNVPGTGNNNASLKPNSGHSFNYSLGQCNIPPYIPTFTNPCCYPILPVCPMNCIQNGYVVPSPSFTCTNCINPKDEKSKNSNNKVCNSETEDLIKEIYKYVTQYPKKNDASERKKKVLSSRSVGGSIGNYKQDARVGTPRLHCYSKSCEAIASRFVPELYYNEANASYSDTILEKLSIEATPSETITETDFTLESADKGKGTKFAKMLRSIGLLKKKKKDVIEELSESESTIEIDVNPKAPPFKQNVTNYMMHEQEYYRPPPAPPMNYVHPEYREQYHSPYQPCHPSANHYVPNRYPPALYEQPQTCSFSGQRQQPCAQSFESYNQVPNVPLCLKEIEVKSIGTQSERKTSFFNKVKSKIQPLERSMGSEDFPQKNCSTQTAQNQPALLNWKKMQSKAVHENPMAYSYMKQKQLAEGDTKMRDALLKKLFYKRNPFSPRNLIVRTLLGKDKSSYGEPPAMFRPRMFF